MKIATLCYIRDNDKVLMIHRNKRPDDRQKGFWNGIGGKAEDSESSEECVIREVKEETGLTITNPRLKGILTFPNNHDVGETWYVFVFIAKDFTGTLTENEEGTLEWVKFKELPKLHLQNADQHFLPWLDKKGIFSAKFWFEGEEIREQSVTFYE